MGIGLVSRGVAAYQSHHMRKTSEATVSAPNFHGGQTHALLVQGLCNSANQCSQQQDCLMSRGGSQSSPSLCPKSTIIKFSFLFLFLLFLVPNPCQSLSWVFTWINSLNPQNNTMRQVLLPSLFCGHLGKVKKLASGYPTNNFQSQDLTSGACALN